VIVCDTSGLIAAYGRDQEGHQQVTDTLRRDAQQLILSPFVLAELDYMVCREAGPEAGLTVLEDVANGVYQLAEFTSADVSRARDVVARYTDLKIGLADASIVVLAARHETARVLTFDHRHFRTIKPLYGEAFTLLPADA
jgi:uncharacterized protein